MAPAFRFVASTVQELSSRQERTGEIKGENFGDNFRSFQTRTNKG